MIYAIGDSNTYGEELDSQDQAWPTLLAQMLGKPVTNLGRSGSGNTRIVKRAMDAVLNGSATMLILGWADPLRQEVADEHGIFDLRGHDSTLIEHRQDLVKYYVLHSVEQYHYVNWLRQIILIQNLCKQHQVQCIMFISWGAHRSNIRFLHRHQSLAKHIDLTDFVGWPHTSMQLWTSHLPRGPNGHTLQQGHEMTAAKIYEHIIK